MAVAAAGDLDGCFSRGCYRGFKEPKLEYYWQLWVAGGMYGFAAIDFQTDGTLNGFLYPQQVLKHLLNLKGCVPIAEMSMDLGDSWVTHGGGAFG